MECMGLSKFAVPSKYLCESCEPRKLKYTPQQAAVLQRRKLKLLIPVESDEPKPSNKMPAQIEASNKSSGDSSMPRKRGRPSTISKLIRHRIVEQNPALATSADETQGFVEITENTYSTKLRNFVADLPNEASVKTRYK